MLWTKPSTTLRIHYENGPNVNPRGILTPFTKKIYFDRRPIEQYDNSKIRSKVKFCYLYSFLAVCTLFSCKSKSHSIADDTVTILIGKECKVKAASVVEVSSGYFRDGVSPDKILIRKADCEDSIRLSSENGHFGPLQELYGPGKYNGQVILLQRNGNKTLFSGSSLSHYWYIVDEDVTIDSVIKTVSSNPEAAYMLFDVGRFRKNIPNMTVQIDHVWPKIEPVPESTILRE